ncbi:MAG TPA: DUF177 domain-containing protein [Gemmatimonadaceae bacterium]
MLSFDIRSLDTHAAVVDEQLSADDAVWQEGDPMPLSSIHVVGRLSATGTGQFYWHGRIEGDVALDCSRCLNPASAHVRDETHLIYAEPGGEETDDPDVYLLDPNARELDLRPAIREQWLLAAPSYTLCRDECKGLCPRCGTDLNAGACNCEEKSVDPRWDTLRKLGGSSR